MTRCAWGWRREKRTGCGSGDGLSVERRGSEVQDRPRPVLGIDRYGRATAGSFRSRLVVIALVGVMILRCGMVWMRVCLLRRSEMVVRRTVTVVGPMVDKVDERQGIEPKEPEE